MHGAFDQTREKTRVDLVDFSPLDPDQQHMTNLRPLTEQIDAIINCTLICVKNKTKLTNFMKLMRIEGYSDE